MYTPGLMRVPRPHYCVTSKDALLRLQCAVDMLSATLRRERNLGAGECLTPVEFMKNHKMVALESIYQVILYVLGKSKLKTSALQSAQVFAVGAAAMPSCHLTLRDS